MLSRVTPQLVDASSGLQSAAWLLVALPLLSAAVLLLLGGRRPTGGATCSARWSPVALFVYAVMLFFQLQGLTGGRRAAGTCTCSAGSRSAASGSTSGCCSTRCRWSSCC